MSLPYNLKAHGITDERVIAAFQKIERKEFVDLQYRWAARADNPLPIGHGQTISQPSLVAYMTQLLDIHAEHKILEIGTGSGFQTAILAEIAAEVYSIEKVTQLVEKSKRRLKKMGYKNIVIQIGDGREGIPKFSPYDRIMVTAASEDIPNKLLNQLTAEGKMLLPVGKPGQVQHLNLLNKTGISIQDIPVRFVPLVKN